VEKHVSNRPPAWVDPLMRFGYTARGIVYVLVGAFAFVAFVDGSRTPDSKTALGTLLHMPFGKVLLAVIALGLLAYALWCFIDAGFDLDDKGNDAKGWTARAAKIISGAVHVAFALSVRALAIGSDSPSSGADRTEHWTGVLMQQPLGRSLVAVVGGIAIAIGAQHFVAAFRQKYKRHIRYTRAAQRLDPVLRLGLVAHGAVVTIVGIFFVWAAWTADPSRAGGLRDALLIVRNADASQTLFAGVGLGLLGFAAYCFVQAAFRIVPRCVPPDLETLASRARAVLARN
jgi:uncharacterized membrane protein YidH (DUF202 family)